MKAFLIAIQGIVFFFALFMCNLTFWDYKLTVAIQVSAYCLMAGSIYCFCATIRTIHSETSSNYNSVPNDTVLIYSIPRLLLSALTGFLVAAILVFVPGTLLMRPSLHGEPQQEILSLNNELEMKYLSKGRQPPQSLDELMMKAFWLTVLQNEIKCFPFLVLCSCLGPAMIMNQRRKRS